MKSLGITHSICPRCGRLVPARVEVDAEVDAVYHRTFCPSCQEGQRSLIRRDVNDYLQSHRYVRPAWQSRSFSGDKSVACPEGCGFCSRHEQHLCMPIIEITTRCNLACPICIADASGQEDMSLETFNTILDRLIQAEGQIDVLNLSGGEPLEHPRVMGILDAANGRKEIVRVSVSTNGLALLDNAELAEQLAERNVVLSLQMDGYDDDAYRILRGRPLAKPKEQILELLQQADISTSLTMTLAAGVNESQLPRVVRTLFERDHIISLMVQPLAFAGRGANLAGQLDRLSIPDVVKLLASSHRGLEAQDFLPLPCSHPLCFSLAFYLRLQDGGTVSLGRLLDTPSYLDSIANRGLFGLDAQEFDRLRDMVYELWSGPAGTAPDTRSVLTTLTGILRDLSGQCDCFDPRKAFAAAERHINSIFIHAFQDAATFDLARVRRCCNAYPQADGSLIPACVHNVMGRGR
jgi:hypothetical protein